MKSFVPRKNIILKDDILVPGKSFVEFVIEHEIEKMNEKKMTLIKERLFDLDQFEIVLELENKQTDHVVVERTGFYERYLYWDGQQYVPFITFSSEMKVETVTLAGPVTGLNFSVNYL